MSVGKCGLQMIIVVYRQSGAFRSELSMLRNARELFRLRGVQESYLQCFSSCLVEVVDSHFA